MFGLLYLLWAMISNTGAIIKEANHNIHAKVNPRTNTFINYQGRLVDYDTGELRFWSIEPNGDEVLRDKRQNIVRNISEEERIKGYFHAKNNNDGSIAFNTKEKRYIKFFNGINNVTCRATIYKDLSTGEEYVTANVMVDRIKKIKKEFYLRASDPNTLVCISDYQRDIEKACKDRHLYNWITYHDDEKKFIDENNKKEKSIFSGRELIYRLN